MAQAWWLVVGEGVEEEGFWLLRCVFVVVYECDFREFLAFIVCCVTDRICCGLAHTGAAARCPLPAGGFSAMLFFSFLFFKEAYEVTLCNNTM